MWLCQQQSIEVSMTTFGVKGAYSFTMALFWNVIPRCVPSEFDSRMFHCVITYGLWTWIAEGNTRFNKTLQSYQSPSISRPQMNPCRPFWSEMDCPPYTSCQLPARQLSPQNICNTRFHLLCNHSCICLINEKPGRSIVKLNYCKHKFVRVVLIAFVWQLLIVLSDSSIFQYFRR